jgi:hypothetical protein
MTGLGCQGLGFENIRDLNLSIDEEGEGELETGRYT